MGSPEMISGSGPTGIPWSVQDSAEVEAELGNSVDILSPRTAEVRINGFDGELRVSLADIPQRFSPLDPRLDPFIQALPALFQGTRNGQPAELLYVSRNMGIRELQEQLRAAGFSDDSCSYCGS